jgi:hypothetical protein
MNTAIYSCGKALLQWRLQLVVHIRRPVSAMGTLDHRTET